MTFRKLRHLPVGSSLQQSKHGEQTSGSVHSVGDASRSQPSRAPLVARKSGGQPSATSHAVHFILDAEPKPKPESKPVAKQNTANDVRFGSHRIPQQQSATKPAQERKYRLTAKLKQQGSSTIHSMPSSFVEFYMPWDTTNFQHK